MIGIPGLVVLFGAWKARRKQPAQTADNGH
jgi:hypothetical protein